MKIFGVDPGSQRTGYGCIETDGSRCRLVVCGAITLAPRTSFPDKLARIFDQLSALLAEHRPTACAVEDLFFARNARSALKLGHVRGVAVLAAAKAGLPVAEYAPSEIKRAVVGYGRADKQQVQQMVTLLLGLAVPPTPYDVSDALAVAVCHAHLRAAPGVPAPPRGADADRRTWRGFRPPA